MCAQDFAVRDLAFIRYFMSGLSILALSLNENEYSVKAYI